MDVTTWISQEIAEYQGGIASDASADGASHAWNSGYVAAHELFANDYFITNMQSAVQQLAQRGFNDGATGAVKMVDLNSLGISVSVPANADPTLSDELYGVYLESYYAGKDALATTPPGVDPTVPTGDVPPPGQLATVEDKRATWGVVGGLIGAAVGTGVALATGMKTGGAIGVALGVAAVGAGVGVVAAPKPEK